MANAPDQFAHAAELTIRVMHDADVAEVIGIERASYQFPWTEGIFHDCLRVSYLCRVAVQGQHIVGYAVMSMGAGEAHILNLCVREESRRAGVGRQLIRYLLDQAEALSDRVVGNPDQAAAVTSLSAPLRDIAAGIGTLSNDITRRYFALLPVRQFLGTNPPPVPGAA